MGSENSLTGGRFEDERKCIAENGYNKVLQYHSYDARIKFILDKLGCLV